MSVCLTPPALRRERFSRVEGVRGHPEGALVRFSCAHGIGNAQAIAGCTVLAKAEDLSLGPLDASFESLIGRTVVDGRRGELGRIEEVIETPAHPVWCVRGGSFGEVLIPVVEETVPAIPAEGPIAVRLMDGLIEA